MENEKYLRNWLNSVNLEIFKKVAAVKFDVNEAITERYYTAGLIRDLIDIERLIMVRQTLRAVLLEPDES